MNANSLCYGNLLEACTYSLWLACPRHKALIVFMSGGLYFIYMSVRISSTTTLTRYIFCFSGKQEVTNNSFIHT